MLPEAPNIIIFLLYYKALSHLTETGLLYPVQLISLNSCCNVNPLQEGFKIHWQLFDKVIQRFPSSAVLLALIKVLKVLVCTELSSLLSITIIIQNEYDSSIRRIRTKRWITHTNVYRQHLKCTGLAAIRYSTLYSTKNLQSICTIILAIILSTSNNFLHMWNILKETTKSNIVYR